MAQLVNAPTLTYMALLPVLSFTLFCDALGWKKSVCAGLKLHMLSVQREVSPYVPDVRRGVASVRKPT
ncbi:MAG: hypothetical protein IIC18_08280 [Bacteroidetes bacterium]|nr:hypothetical protein [Bacteroidota bacterium]MCH8032087.1 hypothetical protein [Bacteroidota bacterium]